MIDSLVKFVILYDDKLVITLNYKNEPITVPTTDELDEVEKISDTEAFALPVKRIKHSTRGAFSFFAPCARGTHTPDFCYIIYYSVGEGMSVSHIYRQNVQYFNITVDKRIGL